MTKAAALTAITLAFAGGSALAQSPAPAPVQSSAPASGINSVDPNLALKDTTTWYVMIAIEQALGPRGCQGWRYKVSMAEPLVIEGPSQVSGFHADELVSAWMLHLNESSPTAYKWLNGLYGHDSPQVYFRQSREEAIEAFREDGHLKLNRTCERSALVAHGTAKFAFDPPEGFDDPDFGGAPVRIEGMVTRQLAKIPGLPTRN